MTTEKKRLANRKNAQKSTGPKTARGKAISSNNAHKHGVLAITPLLKDMENRCEWDEHRKGFFESLSPQGYLEELLASRLAVISWRLARVIRFESEVATFSVATVAADAEEDEQNAISGDQLVDSEEQIREASSVINTLKAVCENGISDDTSIEQSSAVNTLWEIWRQVNHSKPISIPGIPDDHAEFELFNKWTAGLVRKALQSYAAAGGLSEKDLVSMCLRSAYDRARRAPEEERASLERLQNRELILDREKSKRTLLEPDVLAKVSRYESNLERSFFKTLHELQRIQASRLGTVPPPMA